MKQTLLFSVLVILSTATPVIAMEERAEKEQKFICLLGLTNKGYLGLRADYKNLYTFMDSNENDPDTNLEPDGMHKRTKNEAEAVLSSTQNAFFTMQRSKHIRTMIEKQQGNCLACLACLIPEMSALKLSYQKNLSSTQEEKYEGPQDLQELFNKESRTILEKFEAREKATSPRS